MTDENTNPGQTTPVADVEPVMAPDNNPQPAPEVAPAPAGGIQMVAPSPLGAIEKSKSLINQSTRKRLNLMSMLDVPVTLIMEVGRTPISVEQLMELVEGSIIDLRKVSVDSIDVRMNKQVIAQAEAISMQQRYGIRITSLEKMPSAEEEDAGAV